MGFQNAANGYFSASTWLVQDIQIFGHSQPRCCCKEIFLDEVNIEMRQITFHNVALSNQLKAVREKAEVPEEEVQSESDSASR